MTCRARLARVVSRIVPPHEIEDIVQETYVLVCQFKHDKEIRRPQGFMVKTARNLALDHVKRAEWRLASSLDEQMEALIEAGADTSDATFKQAASDEEFARFCEVVRQLPVQCRRVFVLKKVYGYSQKEIARELGLSEHTVEKHVAKGIELCARLILDSESSQVMDTATKRPLARRRG
nr:sigma-70 family RNA polymerase sigma factor [Steroidobacter sp.]